jgi:hypothetical protein
MDKRQVIAKMYNARSTIESMVTMLSENIIDADQALAGVTKRLDEIFEDRRGGDEPPL